MNSTTDKKVSAPSPADIFVQWLRRFGCALSVRFNHYDHDQHNLLINQSRVAVAGRNVLQELLGSDWEIITEASPVAGGDDAMDFEITFRCTGGAVKSASVSVELEFSNWSAKNYVLLPAAAYNGNRFPSRRIPYSPKLFFPQDIGPDKSIIITDVPKLNEAEGASRIQERSGSLAVPGVGFHSENSGKGFWLLTTQGNSLGDYGVGIEENRDRSRAVISLTSPVVREFYNYRNCDMRFPSQDVPKDFKAGDVVTMTFRVHSFPATDVQALFNKFAEVRNDFVGGQKTKCALPFSACFALQEEKFNRENFVPQHGYYSVGPRQNFLQDWQIGWTGGMISTYPLLFSGDAQTRKNVLRNFDWLFPNGISPSGFFWDCGANGTEWIGGDIRKPHTGDWHLIRKSADAVFFIIKQFRLMEKLGIAVKPAWRDGVKTVCGSFVKLWNANGQFGQFVHARTGEICVGGSTSAAIAPAALVLAADYFQEPEYLEIAKQSAEKFYREFTRAGLSCGGPGDALQNPDSESWYALIESYGALAEATGDAEWLKRAGEAARQFSTWVVAYDFEFPPQSTFAKAGIRTTGSVYANTQNKHSAPGICLFSGLGLLKLFRATDDKFPLELLHDIARGLPQYLPHPLKPVGDAVFGRMCERVNLTDWEGVERIGETLHLTTWAETSLMLTTIEIPGVYVQPDKSLVVAFDNIEAEIVSDTASELVVKLANPTPATACVKIFAESSAAAKLLLPENILFNGRTEELKPGETRTLTFKK